MPRRSSIPLAAALAALCLALPAAAQDDPVGDYQAKSPSCDANPTAQWIGRASGESDEDLATREEPVSFVGCFKTQAECQLWLDGATGLIDGRIIENVCELRSNQ